MVKNQFGFPDSVDSCLKIEGISSSDLERVALVSVHDPLADIADPRRVFAMSRHVLVSADRPVYSKKLGMSLAETRRTRRFATPDVERSERFTSIERRFRLLEKLYDLLPFERSNRRGYIVNNAAKEGTD